MLSISTNGKPLLWLSSLLLLLEIDVFRVKVFSWDVTSPPTTTSNNFLKGTKTEPNTISSTSGPYSTPPTPGPEYSTFLSGPASKLSSQSCPESSWTTQPFPRTPHLGPNNHSIWDNLDFAGIKTFHNSSFRHLYKVVI